ncbi:MAG: hypothetical protein FJ029_03490, partial [Actinobacteria bacterium]|nr:hypothetical protein [Actinomycetota bacterium]
MRDAATGTVLTHRSSHRRLLALDQSTRERIITYRKRIISLECLRVKIRSAASRQGAVGGVTCGKRRQHRHVTLAPSLPRSRDALVAAATQILRASYGYRYLWHAVDAAGQLTYGRNQAALAEEVARDGKFVLRTNDAGLAVAEAALPTSSCSGWSGASASSRTSSSCARCATSGPTAWKPTW